ncbi:SAM-dependent methyltransferase [Nocardia sp. CDC159]|uniref:SAM-dependent methyltransferase n=1 Tax=Nocardia pulmonis TaxID=2951408 RepID=A0A9X2ECY5_9NOCA|nr:MULTISPECIES: SAM-dependent methyltransferase [Nocardia]MCM6778602.1 SAM-dependent methyltransferase [Nocardia pulmonis]MCM6791491.1 SAM-dependent methyltransferase [Nocardia sp. CDC159]
MNRPAWAPEGVDMTQASPARMYDALLGGSHNFEVDRRAAEMGKQLVPDLPRLALSNRAFLRRAVRFLADAGIRQFLDIGSGIPTAGNVHEVAQSIDPEIRVLYVDIDPVAVTHSRTILHDNDRAGAIQADLRKPDELLARAGETGLIDFTEPVGLLLVAVLHLLQDEERPAEMVAALRAAVPAGSHVAISHLTSAQRPEDAAKLGHNSASVSRVGIQFRDRAAITALFDGWELVEPGVVELPLWHPESERDLHETPGRSLGLAGVGRKA